MAGRIGIDVAGTALVVARQGLRSVFWNRLAHLGQWVPTPAEPTWRSGPAPIDLLVADDLEQHGHLAAVLAVPGWFGFVDRSTLRRALESDRHRIATVVVSSTAAAVWAVANDRLGVGARRVLAVDVGIGVTASLVSIDRSTVVEHGVGGVAPGSAGDTDSATTINAALDGLLARHLRRERDVEVDTPPVDAVLLVADDAAAPAAQIVQAHLAELGARCSPPIVPVVVDRGGVVAEGALVLADPAAAPIASAAPCGLGVLVQDTSAVGVLPVLERDAALPVVVTSVFALDGGPGGDAGEVVVEWVEVRAEPGHLPRRALVAHGVADLLPTITSAQGVLEVDLLVGGDGELTPLPAACWVVEHGAPQVRVVSAGDDEWADEAGGDSPSDNCGADRPDAADPLPEDPLLDVLAQAEVSPLSLSEALVNVERIVSHEVGASVAIRSIHELLGCADDAEEATLRSAAQRLESALSSRPVDDSLVVAVDEALRAVRRAFHDPDRRWCFGGSQAQIEADLVRTVEHLELVVGECSAAERQRAAADARAAGLPRQRVDAVLSALLGPPPVDMVGEGTAPTDAVVWVDPADGRCLLVEAVGGAAAPIRVVLSPAALVG